MQRSLWRHHRKQTSTLQRVVKHGIVGVNPHLPRANTRTTSPATLAILGDKWGFPYEAVPAKTPHSPRHPEVGLRSSSSAAEGVWSYIWAKISIFIHASDNAVGKLVLQAAVASDIKSGSYSATFVPFAEEYQFFEALNFLYMFAVSLGLCTAHILSDFLHHVVFDTIGMRRRSWQYASELLLVMLKHLDRSARKLTLSNIYDESHLNSRMEEADRGMEKRYPKAAFFRIHGGNPSRDVDKNDKPKTDPNVKNVKWNKNDTKTGRPCLCFNANPPRIHFSRELFDDGTCKGAHVCDKWVSNKGPNGRCLGTEGTAGHNRSACDNPNKCDERVQ